MKGNGMFLVSGGMMEDAKKLAETLVASGQERGELEFSPRHPLVVTTDKTKVGEMVSFEMGGKRFYIGFE
jgi:hypothetical protein